MRLRRKVSRAKQRRGAVVAEFAVLAPVLMLLVFGLCEMGQAVSGASRVASAIREGGRLASMDFTGKLQANQTANQKVIQDILTVLQASGVSTDNVQIRIVHADGSNAGSTFDLASPDNYLSYFRIEVSVPYSNISTSPVSIMKNAVLESSTTFRRGRTPIEYE